MKRLHISINLCLSNLIYSAIWMGDVWELHGGIPDKHVTREKREGFEGTRTDVRRQVLLFHKEHKEKHA